MYFVYFFVHFVAYSVYLPPIVRRRSVKKYCLKHGKFYRNLAGLFSRAYYMLSALYAIARPSVCPSVRHTGGSVKNG